MSARQGRLALPLTIHSPDASARIAGTGRQCAGVRPRRALRHRAHRLACDSGVCGCTGVLALPSWASSWGWAGDCRDNGLRTNLYRGLLVLVATGLRACGCERVPWPWHSISAGRDACRYIGRIISSLLTGVNRCFLSGVLRRRLTSPRSIP